MARLPPHARGASLTAKLLVHGDSTVHAATAPLRQWHRAVWLSAVERRKAQVSATTLSKWWRAAAPRASDSWANSRGPINAAILSAKRIGWSMISAFEAADDRGNRMQLADISPAGFLQVLKEAVQRRHEEAAARAFANHTGRSGPRRVAFDIPRKLYRSKKITGPQRAAVATLACDGFWTKTRLRDAGYVLPDTLCDVCRGAEDTLFHRLFECKATAHIRDSFISPDDLGALLDQAHVHHWQTRAIRPHPAAAAPPPRDAGCHFE